jgi:hypothetical protein
MARHAGIWLAVAALGLTLAASTADAQVGPAPWAGGGVPGEDLTVKLVTFGVGDAVPSFFGHSGIVIEHEQSGRSRLYNYGMFSFDGAFLWKFARGRLVFWVGAQPVEPTYDFYKSMGRDVRIQVLNLTPEATEELATHLEWKIKKENRTYLYDHYEDNCATRPRDLIDAAVDGALREATSEPSKWTFRGHTRRYAGHSFWMMMVMLFLENDTIDRPIEKWDAMFLPDELEKHVQALTYRKHPDGPKVPLVNDRWIYFDAGGRTVPEAPPIHWPLTLGLGLLAGLAAVAGRHWRLLRPASLWSRIGYGLYMAWIGLFVGMPGLVLFLMSVLTDHEVTYWNENLYLTHPVTAAALPLGVAVAAGAASAGQWLRWVWTVTAASGLMLLCLKPLPMFDQQNLLSMTLILPITLGCAVASWWGKIYRPPPEAPKT